MLSLMIDLTFCTPSYGDRGKFLAFFNPKEFHFNASTLIVNFRLMLSYAHSTQNFVLFTDVIKYLCQFMF